MASRDYQYETSPRKYEPEYEPRKKKKVSKTQVKKKATTKKKSQSKKQKAREARKNRILIFVNAFFILAILFAIIFRNALVSQNFAEIQDLKAKIASIQKENDQLEISIQNNLNLSNIEQEAQEKLGMQKLTSRQTIYLNLPKKDYVEPSAEEVIIEDDENIFEKIIDFVTSIF